MPVAATVAYFKITEAAKQVRAHEDLAEIRRLVAIALADQRTALKLLKEARVACGNRSDFASERTPPVAW